MVTNSRPTPDPVITSLIQRAISRRSDLTPEKRASLASILDHRAQSYGRPGIDTIIAPPERYRR